MTVDIKSLAPLAEAVAKAGAPVLAQVLGTVLPFPANLIAKTVVGALASAFGVSPDDPDAVAAAVAADPDAAAKVQAVEDAHRTDVESALDYAKLQVQTNSEELAVEGRWTKVFFAGWRPVFAWSVVVWVNFLLVRAANGTVPTAEFLALWNPVWLLFGGLMGLRTAEKWLGVAPGVVAIIKKIRS